MFKLKKCFFDISINIVVKFLICASLKFYTPAGKLGHYNIAQKSTILV